MYVKSLVSRDNYINHIDIRKCVKNVSFLNNFFVFSCFWEGVEDNFIHVPIVEMDLSVEPVPAYFQNGTNLAPFGFFKVVLNCYRTKSVLPEWKGSQDLLLGALGVQAEIVNEWWGVALFQEFKEEFSLQHHTFVIFYRFFEAAEIVGDSAVHVRNDERYILLG